MSERITGVVTTVRNRGFKVAGREEWLNLSKWGPTSDIAPPAQGDHVECELDAKGFVRALAIANGGAPARQASGGAVPMGDPRGDAITRQACMNTATAILASGGRATTPLEVLRLAAVLERWAREGGPVDDLLPAEPAPDCPTLPVGHYDASRPTVRRVDVADLEPVPLDVAMVEFDALVKRAERARVKPPTRPSTLAAFRATMPGFRAMVERREKVS